MKKFNINLYYIALIIVVSVLILCPDIVMAQSAGGTNDAKGQISQLFLNKEFKLAVDLGLIIFAGYQWFLYFNGFDPSKAFKDAIVPAVITWFAFNWTTALSWVGIISV